MDSGQKIAPLFSVIIPLYNKADTIARTVRSVVAQTFNDWELIVVNDGSTDDSLSVAKQLSKDIPMRIIDKPNGGVSSARNAGAEVAVGRYIALLDGDDAWHSCHLRYISEAIDSYPTVGFFGCGYEKHSNNWRYFTIPWGGCRIADVYAIFRFGQPINSSTVAIRRDLWEKVRGFNEQLSFYEDYEFFFRLGLYTKCCVVRKISGIYYDDAKEQATKRHRELSKSTRPQLAFVDERIRDGTASHQMVMFAGTQLGIILCNAYLKNLTPLAKHISDLFPNVVAACPMLGRMGRERRLLTVLYSYLFLAYYKIRCHMIVWRKHE